MTIRPRWHLRLIDYEKKKDSHKSIILRIEDEAVRVDFWLDIEVFWTTYIRHDGQWPEARLDLFLNKRKVLCIDIRSESNAAYVLKLIIRKRTFPDWLALIKAQKSPL